MHWSNPLALARFLLLVLALPSAGTAASFEHAYALHARYRMNVMVTAAQDRHLVAAPYQSAQVEQRINEVLRGLAQHDEPKSRMQQALLSLWGGLPRPRADDSLANWAQANLDRLVVVSTFELLDGRSLDELLRAVLPTLLGQPHADRTAVVRLWEEFDRAPTQHMETRSLTEFKGWLRSSGPESLANPGHTKPIILAHRGGSGPHPENTLAALRYGLAHGADGIECDVRLAGDDAVVVIHDADLERLTGQSLELRSLTRSDLRHVTLLDPLDRSRRTAERPLLLDELLRQWQPGKWIWLELKPGEPLRLAEKVGDLLQKHAAIDRMIVASFAPQMLEPLRRRFPNLRIAYEFHTLQEPELRSLLDAPDRGRLVVSVNHLESADEDRLVALHNARLETSSFTVNRFDALRRAVRLGITFIQTDRPDRALFIRSAGE